RIKLRYTRAMVTAALSGALEKGEFVKDPVFGVDIPLHVEGVPAELLIPEKSWEDKAEYLQKVKELATGFVNNFKKYETASPEVVAAGPDISQLK
ncbi:MAG: phosphoenolpyruvate carboxykinase (ATP), partial [Clostridiales bacterium]|nr:phosphoenolpyruvate carboxykinase (ATP) [Clostridiales bacterium]